MTTHVLYFLRMKSPYFTVDDIPAVPSLHHGHSNDIVVAHGRRGQVLYSPLDAVLGDEGEGR